jgi:hypothetical protein
MRALLLFLFTLGLFTAVHASDSVTGKVVKVLPLLLDQQGRDATSPSLFNRDAYQVFLRDHTNEISAVRYNVQWSASKAGETKLNLRLELRGVGDSGVPRLRMMETEVTPGSFRQWTAFKLEGDAYKNFGAIVAWRVTLWNGAEFLGEQKSFLW